MRTSPSRNGRLALLGAALVSLTAVPTEARIDFSVLQQAGYGMVEIKRPQPNVLSVLATINGRKALLVVDTGWSGEGIAIDSEMAASLKIQPEKSEVVGHTLSGKKIGVRKGVADTVLLGNVQMRQVPIFFGNFGALHNASMRRLIGADGFVSSGFLRTCSGLLDLQNLRLFLRPPGTGKRAMIGQAMRGAGLAEVPFVLSSNRNAFVDVEINGAAGKMIVDTGKALTGVDSRFASKMKVVGYSSRVGTIDAAGAVTQTTLTKIQSFKISGVSLRAPDVRLEEFPVYTETQGKLIGFLGMDILGPNGTIIDYGQLKLYFYPL